MLRNLESYHTVFLGADDDSLKKKNYLLMICRQAFMMVTVCVLCEVKSDVLYPIEYNSD